MSSGIPTPMKYLGFPGGRFETETSSERKVSPLLSPMESPPMP